MQSIRRRHLAVVGLALMLAAPTVTTAQSPGASQPAGATTGGVAFLLPGADPRYDALDLPVFTARLAEVCPGVQLITSNAGGDAAVQVQQVADAVKAGAKALVIGAVDPKVVGAAAKDAEAQGAQVISYEQLLKGGSKPAAFLGVDWASTGLSEAYVLTDVIYGLRPKANKLRVIMLDAPETDAHAAAIAKAAHKSFKDRQYKVAAAHTLTEGTVEEAQQLVAADIDKLGAKGFDGIYAYSDVAAEGAIAALQAAGIDPASKPVAGAGATLEGIQRVLGGTQALTEYLPLDGLPRTAATLACGALGTYKPNPGDVFRFVDFNHPTVNNGTADIQHLQVSSGAVTAAGRVDPYDSSVLRSVVADAAFGPDTVAQICTPELAATCDQLGIGVDPAVMSQRLCDAFLTAAQIESAAGHQVTALTGTDDDFGKNCRYTLDNGEALQLSVEAGMFVQRRGQIDGSGAAVKGLGKDAYLGKSPNGDPLVVWGSTGKKDRDALTLSGGGLDGPTLVLVAQAAATP